MRTSLFLFLLCLLFSAFDVHSANREQAIEILRRTLEVKKTTSYMCVYGPNFSMCNKQLAKDGKALKRTETCVVEIRPGVLLGHQKDFFDMENGRITSVIDIPGERVIALTCKSDRRAFYDPMTVDEEDSYSLKDSVYNGRPVWKITRKDISAQQYVIYYVDKELEVTVCTKVYNSKGEKQFTSKVEWTLNPVFDEDEFTVPKVDEVYEFDDPVKMYLEAEKIFMGLAALDGFEKAAEARKRQSRHFTGEEKLRLWLFGTAAICIAGGIVLKVRRRSRNEA